MSDWTDLTEHVLEEFVAYSIFATREHYEAMAQSGITARGTAEGTSARDEYRKRRRENLSRPCLGCKTDLKGRHMKTKYCTPNCRWKHLSFLERQEKKANTPRHCAHCKKDIRMMRLQAKYCSKACAARGWAQVPCVVPGRVCLREGCGVAITTPRVTQKYCSAKCRKFDGNGTGARRAA